MKCYKQSLYKPLENLDELHEVMVDAYRSGVVLHYCLKCFTTFLTSEEREEHDEIHKNKSNGVCVQTKNSPNRLVKEVQFNKSSLQENNQWFLKADHSNNITLCYVCCKQFSSIETKLVHLQIHLDVNVRKCTTGYVKAQNVGKQLLKCNKCEKEFACNNDLTRHQRTHIGENLTSVLCVRKHFLDYII